MVSLPFNQTAERSSVHVTYSSYQVLISTCLILFSLVLITFLTMSVDRQHRDGGILREDLQQVRGGHRRGREEVRDQRGR